jgi:hypothetical protein
MDPIAEKRIADSILWGSDDSKTPMTRQAQARVQGLAMVSPQPKEWLNEDGHQCSSSVHGRNVDGDRFDIPLTGVAPG